jgi:hypothetical protein
MRREAFASVGGYRAAFAQAEDYDLWLRIAQRYKVANLKQVVLKYRVHPNQMSVRKQKQQMLCILAAQMSLSARSSGNPDPLDAVKEITPALLSDLGISEAMLQSALVSHGRDWVRIMAAANEGSAALNATMEILQSSDLKHVERWQIADLWLFGARVYWKQKRFLRSLLAVGHAVIVRPALVGRPLKMLLCRRGYHDYEDSDPGLPQVTNNPSKGTPVSLQSHR